MSDAPNTPTETSFDPAVLTSQVTGNASGVLGTQAQLPTPVQDSVQSQPSQPATPQISPAQAADHAKHYSIGKAVASIFGTDTNYSIDPKTGQTVATPVKQAPGALFKHLVAGALLGGAFASEAPGNSFGVGVARGGAGVIERDDKLDEQKRKQAQDEFRNRQSVRSEDRQDEQMKQEKIYRDAQIAQFTASNIAAAHEHEFHEKEFAQRVSEYNTNLQLKLADMNVQPLTILSHGENINGQPNNGNDIAAFGYDKLKSLVPQGYTALPIQNIDSSGIGTWTVYAVGPDGMKQDVNLDAGELKKLGITVPKDFVGTKIPFSQYVGLNEKAIGAARDEARDARADRRESDRETHESLIESSRLAENKMISLKEQLRIAEEPGEDGKTDPAQIKRVQGQLDALDQQQTETYNRLRAQNVDVTTGVQTKRSNLPKPSREGAVITPDIVKQYLAANGNDAAKARDAAQKAGWTVK